MYTTSPACYCTPWVFDGFCESLYQSTSSPAMTGMKISSQGKKKKKPMSKHVFSNVMFFRRWDKGLKKNQYTTMQP